MIVNVDQVKTGFNMLWMASCQENNLCVVNLPTEKGKLMFSFDFNNNLKKTMYYNPFDTRFGNSLEEKMTYRVFENEVLQGEIIGKTQKCPGFLQSYAYTHMTYKGKEYFLYETGFGKQGLFLNLYQGDTLVAVAEKDLTVYNFKDTYTMYLSSAEYFEPFIFALIRYDMLDYGDAFEIAIASRKRKYVKTIQKELLAKYDPTFIPRVKALAGIQ